MTFSYSPRPLCFFAATEPRYDLIFKFVGLLAILIMARMIYLAPHGLDLSDESFYLMWIADPWAYFPDIRLFGLFYHPWHILTGGDIAYLRIGNLIVTWFLSYGLGLSLIKTVQDKLTPERPLKKSHLYGAALLLSAPVCLQFLNFTTTN